MPGIANVLVTTSYRPSEKLVQKANAIALKLGAEYAERGTVSVGKLRKRYGLGKPIIVVKETGLEWHSDEGKEPFFFHPGMSLIRAKRLSQGQRDSMLEACGFAKGDKVIDCTAGLAADSIVFSFAGGAETQVTACESEFPLYYIVSEGLQQYRTDWHEFTSAMRRIETVHTDHTEYLKTLPSESADIVYFDPMFHVPVSASAGLSPLRPLANHKALSFEAVREARRVARKSVLLKEKKDAEEWRKFGFEIVSTPDAPIVYGVIRK